MSKRKFTAIYLKRNGHYIGWIEEISGVNTQGKNKKEVKENLKEALELILKVNRDLLRKEVKKAFVREALEVVI